MIFVNAQLVMRGRFLFIWAFALLSPITGFAQTPTKVLLTGYEPFGGRPVNTSALMLREVRAAIERSDLRHRIELHTLELPVGFRTAHVRLLAEVESLRPQAVLSLGELDIDYIKIEERARNYDRSYAPDNDGWNYRGPIIRGAPEYFSTPFPTEQVERRLRMAGFPVRRSQDAGSFICNHALYYLLHWANAHQTEAPRTIGFIHLPATRMPVGRLAQAILSALEAVLP